MIPGPVLRNRRAIIIGMHLVFFPLAYALAFAFRFDGAVPSSYQRLFWDTVPLLVLLRISCFALYRLYSGWWRFVGMHDLTQLIKALTVSSGLFLGILFVTGHVEAFPRSVLILEWGIAIILFGGIRFGFRWAREGGTSQPWAPGGTRTLIIGAGSGGANLLRHIRQDRTSNLLPVGLVDDDLGKRGFHIHGVPVLGTTAELRELVDTERIDLVVIAIPSATREQMQRIVEQCAGLQVEFKIVPSVRELVDGQARISQLRSVQIEDLLGRTPVNLDLELIDADLAGQVVLITGGAGSIGSELARQVAMFSPLRLVLVEQAESPLYFVHLELCKAHPQLNVVPVIADVTDAERMDQVFAEHRPDCVFHAAAYKHVPMMEANISEAVRNNVLGTFRVASAAVEHGACKFVLISTDKAVHPSSVMGATKRIAERVVLGWPTLQRSRTDFRAVRFGNVLGSDGSVVPLFNKQIAAGGPVTITHREVTRYFMTIPEAVQLILQAASLPEAARRISMLEMGEPVRIVSLAENLIRLSGMEPYTEMPIVFTGLRPGEKLYEELMSAVETTVPTAIDKIRVVQTDDTDASVIQHGVDDLVAALAAGGESKRLLRVICGLVPECVAPLRDHVQASPAPERNRELAGSAGAGQRAV
jgi:FlaA1/EpsC-like NDP-sugar epimerase